MPTWERGVGWDKMVSNLEKEKRNILIKLAANNRVDLEPSLSTIYVDFLLM